MDPLIAFVILGAVAAFSIGCAKLVVWIIDCREEAAHRAMREAELISQARAELSATGWTEQDERAYQRERFGAYGDADVYDFDEDAEVRRG